MGSSNPDMDSICSAPAYTHLKNDFLGKEATAFTGASRCLENRADENSGLTGVLPEIYSLGISIWDPVYAESEHVGDCWELVHIVRGKVTLHVAGTRFRGNSCDTLLVPPTISHRDEFPVGTRFEVLHIMFKWNDGAAVLPLEINRDLVRLPVTDKQVVRELAFGVYQDLRHQRPLWQQTAVADLYRLLLFLISATKELRVPKLRNETAAQKERRRQMIREAKEFILANLDKPIALSDIAFNLRISTYHLSHLFSRESGFTLSSYLTHARMQKAAELLTDPRMRIAEVAYSVGFEDSNYFSKVFRKHFQCSPGRYRARLSRQSRNEAP